MYGVPANLNLEFLRGAMLIQVCLGQYQLQFHFTPTGSILVDGGWELLGTGGEQIDCQHDGPERPPYQLHQLLGCHVIDIEVCPPAWFALRFERGELLRVLDDSEQYESIQISPGGIIV